MKSSIKPICNGFSYRSWHLSFAGPASEFELSRNLTAGWYAIIAVCKLFAISITVLSGFRGGFIFPLFLVGACLGQVITGLHIPFVSGLPPVLLSMSFAAGNVPLVPFTHFM